MSSKKLSKTDREKYKEFKKILNELSIKFQELSRKSRTHTRRTEKQARRSLAIQLYKEILLILSRIDEELFKLQELDMQSVIHWKEGTLDPSSKLFKIINKELHQRELLLLDLKSLFHWIYVLDDTLGLVFPKPIRDFRNIFITHFSDRVSKNKRSRNLMHGMLYSPAGMQMVFFQFSGKRSFQGFKKFITIIKKYIPEVVKETNYNEQIRVIWKNVDKLPKEVMIDGNKTNTIEVLSQYGGRSPSILKVTEAILKVLKKV